MTNLNCASWARLLLVFSIDLKFSFKEKYLNQRKYFLNEGFFSSTEKNLICLTYLNEGGNDQRVQKAYEPNKSIFSLTLKKQKKIFRL